MAVIRIERVPVAVGGLGLIGFDHLQLVYQPDDYDPRLKQDNWYVMEGTRDSGGSGFTLGVEGANGTTTLSAANGGATGEDLQQAIGTAAQRGSRVLPVYDAFGTWQLMASYAREFDAQQFPYISFTLPFSALPTVNSTSVIASLLFYAGLNLSQSWPTGTRFSPGATTLLGTRANDAMEMGEYFTTLLGGVGNDTMQGSSDSRTDRIYGGSGDDIIKWSSGTNYLHGGQPEMDYGSDGIDVVDYAGVGLVEIESNEAFIPGKTPTFTARHANGVDYLFSIERLQWNSNSDQIILDDGRPMMQDGLIMGMMGEGSGRGDSVDFSNRTQGLVAVATANDDEMVVRDADRLGSEKGLWLQSAEWIIGSSGDDRIYSANGLRGLEGGDGSDLLDASDVDPFTGAQAPHVDIELQGGEGDDTLIANAGETLMHGGAGSDWFVLSAMTSGTGTVEITIDDADSGDLILVPYALFDGSTGEFEGSELMPLLGGIGSWSDMSGNGWPSIFDFRTQNDIWLGTDRTQGAIRFLGDISYQIDGSDLVIVLMQGHGETYTQPIDNAGHTRSFTELIFDTDTETRIRIKDFSQGDLGLQFIDPGEPTSVQLPDGTYVLSYPNWDSAVQTLTNGGQREAPIEVAPDAPDMRPDEEDAALAAANTIEGTAGADVIVMAGLGKVQAGDGNDSVTGSASIDIIDGGAGADTLAGGAGSDTYVVDSALDLILEGADGGLDAVRSSADHVLGANIEDLYLTGSATAGTGNGLDNRLAGNDLANILDGAAGSDVLYGGGGNDTLQGGAGGDRYSYLLGDGRDVIVDQGSQTETNSLRISGVTGSEISFYRLAGTPDDLVIGLKDGGSITLAGFLADPRAAIDVLTFDDGTEMTRAELTAAAAVASLYTAAPPAAADDHSLMVASSNAVVDAAALIANDVHSSGQPLQIVGVANASGGTVTLRPDGNLDVAVDTSGIIYFEYTVSDGLGGTSTATAVVEVAANHAPTASGGPGDQLGNVGEAFAMAVAGNLFADADFDPLAFSARLANGSPLPSWLQFDADAAAFSGTPPPGSEGELDIVITASDGLAAATAGFRLTMRRINHAPVAAADSLTADESQPFTVAATALTVNDLDADGDVLAITAVGAATHGSVALGAYGSILFTPEAGYAGPAAFTYQVEDGLGGFASAIVAIDLIASPGRSVGGSSANDLLRGTSGADTLEGGAGNDTLDGFGGNDLFLVAGIATGLDAFNGGAGSDTVRGGAGDDVIGLQGGSTALDGIEVIDGGAGTDALRGSAGSDVIDLSNINVIGIEMIDGGAGHDVIVASAGNDTIKGNTGNDTLHGGGGDDVFLFTGTTGGADVIAGGAGYDRIVGGSGNDTIMLETAAENLTGIEAVEMGAGNDAILGSPGSDYYDLSNTLVTGLELFDAGFGNDTIIASLGDDTLKGGVGYDLFKIGAGTGRHTVTDYTVGTSAAPVIDLIDVTAFGFGSFAAVMSHAAASGTSDTLITLDATTSLKLLGVRPAQLKADDFRLA